MVRPFSATERMTRSTSPTSSGSSTEVAAGRLMNIGKKDLLLAISFPRFASDAVTLTQYARDRGAHIVALTDSVASPLVALADDVLLAPCSHPVLSSSYAAAVVVAEALVASLVKGGKYLGACWLEGC